MLCSAIKLSGALHCSAVWEAGLQLAAAGGSLLCPPANPTHLTTHLHIPPPTTHLQATIVPRGHALGMVSQVPDKDEYSITRQQMQAQIDVCMGGKAAEELIFGAWQEGRGQRVGRSWGW